MSDVILYGYDVSPFTVKVIHSFLLHHWLVAHIRQIDYVLLLKNIRHEKVIVANMIPRPEITDLLGVTYRRIPILVIGNDVYCDTSLITSALERRFPASQGYGTIFPNRKHGGGADTGLIKAFVKHWADTALFFLGVRVIDWERRPPEFIKDRSTFLGGQINLEALVAGRGNALSTLSTHLFLVEEQLSDGREWLFDTELPSLADVSVQVIFAWIRRNHVAESLFDPGIFPKFLEWFARMTAYFEELKQKQPVTPRISGEAAAARIAAAPFEPYAVVGFDTREGERLGVKLGDDVSIDREDSANMQVNFPTVGKLVALNREEFVVEGTGSAGRVRCHFPRIGFTASLVSQSK
ncbi:Glutathione s-transferase [Mycena venus]|uniref:Glutathione s-transferase n=1 Tax=Mycena venus TaxID=2733690 RepID=A0A8H7CVF2_9AGAR|nr:Glutathione s-transferase [Mycena venus]